MTDPPACAFKGCSENPTNPIFVTQSPEQAGPWQALVCDFHRLAVDSGEDFDFESETKELVSPLRLVNFAVASKGRGKTVTLMFGRDGVEDERTPEVRMDKEMLQRIIDMLP